MPIRRCDDKAYTLALNLSATGPSVLIPGGEYHFFVEGTAGGATVSLQVQSPNGTWSPVNVYSGSLISYTALPSSQTDVVLPSCNVRLNVSGGAPSGIYAYLVGVG